MAEVKQDVMYKKKYLETIASVILNNKELSDVTFVVNKKPFHASRIHMSAASQVFDSLLNEHFANTTDKEVVLTNIKQDNSFLGILQYIHGIELNLTAMSKVVLCELIDLAKRFKLVELHDDLKAYVSNIRQFKINSVVAMLNTARTYDLAELYDKLKLYVYQYAGQIVKHKTFVNLKYEVLVDLLKSNWMYADEIDILRAALNWHDENIMDFNTVKSKLDSKNCVIALETHEDLNDSNDNIPCKDVPCEIYNENASNVSKKEELSSVVKKFSENVLNKLLEHIRFTRISMFEYLSVADIVPFKKYKNEILKKQSEGFNHEPRVRFNDSKGYSKLFFKVNGIRELMESSYKDGDEKDSKEIHSVKDFNWKISAKVSTDDEISERYLELYLCCSSDNMDWKVDTCYQITLVSNNPVQHKISISGLHTFDPKNQNWGESFVKFTDLFDPDGGFIQDNTITVEVLLKIKSICLD